jgi:FkbM family methyltransferase
MSYALDEIRRLERRHAGIVHVGANAGQDISAYRLSGVSCAVLIEPLDGPFAKLNEAIGNDPQMHSVQALCSSRAGVETNFYVANNAGVSSSMLRPRRHLIEAPSVDFTVTIRMITTTLDTIVAGIETSRTGFSLAQTDVLVVETQGTELHVLKGALRTLRHMQYVYAAIFMGELYEHATDVGNLQDFLRCHGFRLNNFAITRHRWGHALFVR